MIFNLAELSSAWLLTLQNSLPDYFLPELSTSW